jgi:hypothetical protein
MRVRSSFVSARGVRSEARLERADDEWFRERAPSSVSLAFACPSELAFRTSFKFLTPSILGPSLEQESKGAWGQQLQPPTRRLVSFETLAVRQG